MRPEFPRGRAQTQGTAARSATLVHRRPESLVVLQPEAARHLLRPDPRQFLLDRRRQFAFVRTGLSTAHLGGVAALGQADAALAQLAHQTVVVTVTVGQHVLHGRTLEGEVQQRVVQGDADERRDAPDGAGPIRPHALVAEQQDVIVVAPRPPGSEMMPVVPALPARQELATGEGLHVDAAGLEEPALHEVVHGDQRVAGIAYADDVAGAGRHAVSRQMALERTGLRALGGIQVDAEVVRRLYPG